MKHTYTYIHVYIYIYVCIYKYIYIRSHETCGAFPLSPCQPRTVVGNAFVGEASLERFSAQDIVELMPGKQEILKRLNFFYII